MAPPHGKISPRPRRVALHSLVAIRSDCRTTIASPPFSLSAGCQGVETTSPREGPGHAGLYCAPPAGADSDTVLRQPHRVRDGAPHPGQRHRPDAGAERHCRRQAQPRPADLGARPRQADVGAVPELDRRHSAARRFRPLAVAEHAGGRAAAGAPARHLRARPDGADRGAHRRHSHRRLFGRAPGHGRRLYRPLVLDPDAGGAELLDGHHGDGVPVDLVGLVAGGEVRGLQRRTRCTT